MTSRLISPRGAATGGVRPATPRLTSGRGTATGGVRLVALHLASRRVPLAVVMLLTCALGLRVALHGNWDAYGALQLPLFFETGCAVVIAATTASPFGDPERATGRWLPFLRLGSALALTAIAVGALAAFTAGAPLAGGALGALRNTVGSTGIGLLCAVAFGGSLAWTGPTAYLVAGIYALYTQWHPPALTTPWLWPAHPSSDVEAAWCAGLVFGAGLILLMVRGSREAKTRA
ncbi:hypothetical protein [Asanoa ferruginea]|uniref:hypothetical protein n=1 Tax=Asanoa ferruginea TaxID=53367 RepID=UPI0011C14210|nr:hypothetical protein [Asanoa ferruginea]